jgi:hypothetical protein
VFLAIAVDNLATAQELTAEQEEAEALAKEQKEKSAAKEATMFLPNPLISPVQASISESETTKPGEKPGVAGKKPEAKGPTAAAAANQKTAQVAQSTPSTVNKTPTPISGAPNRALKSSVKGNNLDVDKMITRKVDLDYIPGLDDDLKVILPG